MERTPTGLEPGLWKTDNAKYQRLRRNQNLDSARTYSREYQREHGWKYKTTAQLWRASPAGKKYHKDLRLRQRAVRKEFITKAKDKPCLDCDTSYPSYVMDFHHRDPLKKSFELGQAFSRGKSIKLIQAEIDKCDLICSNCHRERHHAKMHPIDKN